MPHRLATLQPRTYGAVNTIGLNTLFQREVRRFLKVSAQTLFAPLITTALYLLVFSLAMGGRPSPFPNISYADFLAPGLIMMGIINNAFANSSSSMMTAKLQGNSVDFLMPPLSPGELATAFIGGAAVRGLLVGLLSALVAASMARVWPVHWGATLLFAVLASVTFGAIGLIGGIWADKFDHMAALTNFLITPLTFLSGTFYSVEVLPGPLAWISKWNPVFFLIDGFRYGFTGHADAHLMREAIFSLALAVLACFLAWRILAKGYKLKA